MKKRLALIFTGGTISMKYDAVIGGAVPALSGRDILNLVKGVEDVADAEIIEFGRYPGPHMTLPRMMELSAAVRATLAREEIAGIVITHGTDTLEETAYLLDLTTASRKPVVLVGAMRNSSEMGWDGPPNLLAAMRVAAADSACDLGVLIVMNDTILAAAEATKTHSESFDAFQSADFGPLGIVDRSQVIIRRQGVKRQHLPATEIVEPVFLIKLAAGCDATLIDAAVGAGARGLVIEALGRGNVPPAVLPGLRRAVERQLPVVLVSRCLRGRVFDSYGYEGGGRQLRELGLIFADFLNGQKARIKLALALSLSDDPAAIRAYF